MSRRRPWYVEIPRRICRLLAWAAPFLLFGLGIGFFYGVPYLVDRGSFDQLMKDRVSEMLATPVDFRHAQIQGTRDLVLDDVVLRTGSEVFGEVLFSRVRVRFGGPAPLGGVEEIELAGPRATIRLDSERIERLTRPAPGPRIKKRWQDRFDVGLAIPEGLRIPPIVVRGGAVEGVIGEERYRIADLHGSIGSVKNSIPFHLRGSSPGHPDPFFKLLGVVERDAERSTLVVQEFKLGEMGVTVSMNTAGGATTLTFDLRAAAITRELAHLIHLLSGGAEVSGKINGKSRLTTRGGRLERFEFRAEAEGYSVRTAGGLAESVQPTVIDLVITPAPDSLDVALSVEQMRFALVDGTLLLGRRFEMKGTMDDVDGDFHWAKGKFFLEGVRVVAGPLKGSEFSRCDVEFDVRRPGGEDLVESSIDLAVRDLFVEHGGRIHDFSGGEVRAALHTREEPARRLLQVARATLHLPEIGILQGFGMLHAPPDGAVFELTLGGHGLSLAGIMRRLQDGGLVDPEMLAEGDVTGTMTARGGPWGRDIRVSAQLDRIQYRHAHLLARDLKGKLQLASRDENGARRLTLRLLFDADFARLGKLDLETPSGDLPLALSYGLPLGDGPLPSGWLKARNVSMGPLVSGPRHFTLIAQDNGLRIVEELQLTGLGGRLTIGPLALKEIVTRDFEMATSVDAEEIDLPELFAMFGAKKTSAPAAKSRFRLHEVRFRKEKLEIKGTIEAEMFAGRVTLSDLVVDQPFSEFASYDCRFEFDRISLRYLWRHLVGKGVFHGAIYGRGSVSVFNTGEINELEIELESDDRREEGRFLDIEALKKVIRALQNDENAASELDKMPYREVTYEKLGVYARVRRNGILQIRGRFFRKKSTGNLHAYTWEQLRDQFTRENVTEYLVVGGGLVPLNVINQTPKNGIALTDFIDRLKGGPKR
jgi:hypothetical protein